MRFAAPVREGKTEHARALLDAQERAIDLPAGVVDLAARLLKR